MTCPFCQLTLADVVFAGPLVVAIRDRYPVSPGHTLVLPRRHVPTWFEATPEEQAAILRAVNEVKAALDAEARRPDGYNVGFNAGEAAGQTVPHLHVHVIPRFHGDMPDPRGGVRGVIPAKQKYGDAEPSDPDDPFGDLLDFVPGEERGFGPVVLEAIRRADTVDLLSAFLQKSGLDLVEADLVDALRRDAAVRVLTGDYLGITHPHALQRLFTLTTAYGGLQAKLWRSGDRPFHAKAYLFRKGAHGVAFVGSSNLSRSALGDAVEWNVRVVRGPTFARVVERFDLLWQAAQAQPLTPELLRAYQAVVRVPPAPEPAAPRPKAHDVQREVLERLEASRGEGARRGLVVMATGLGKTYLAAFDFEQLGGRRALFIAHRQEILEQAQAAWAKVFPDRTAGVLDQARKEVDADLLFGSVQTLARAEHLLSFRPDHFDYIVVDEFHHASAATYRRVLGHFAPRFLLGLTATPDRTDGASLLELCDDNLVARVGIVEGISRGFLSPFRYYGVKDEVDYQPIPWRSGRFAEADLTAAVATRERAAQALREYRRHAPAGPRRTLAFCVSTKHANFMAEWLGEQGVSAAAVHSGEGSAPRAASVERLRAGELEVLCAVDVFNEGLDVPDVNTVLMLRPTESPVVFLQQLGRGLRRVAGKEALVVVDFIGNHRSFLTKPQALLALTGQDVPAGAAVRMLRGELDLPPGCSVVVETEALDMLERISRISAEDRIVYEYLQLRDSLGHRPTAAEVYAAGVHFAPVRARGTWHDFVEARGDLTDDEAAVLAAWRPWFQEVLDTKMSRSYKMVALRELLDAGALTTGMDVRTLAERCRERLSRDVLLRAELREHEEAGGELDDSMLAASAPFGATSGDPSASKPRPEGALSVASPRSSRVASAFVQRWREMPLKVLTGRWFALQGDRFVSKLPVPEDQRATFEAMTAEVVELRMREYKARLRHTDDVLPFAAPITMRVSHVGGNPILRFDRTRRPDIPEGDVDVLVDGEPVTFRFVRIAVNVASERDGGPNVLPTRLRRWFGPHAGQPGTRHEVVLERVGEAWRLRPAAELSDQAEVVPFPRLPFFEDLRVACGPGAPQVAEQADRRAWLGVEATVPLDPRRHFLVRATGDSMDGGAQPIRDGDLVLCAWTDAVRPEQVEGKPVLLAGHTAADDLAFAQIKVPVRAGGRWVLRSWNPAHADRPVDEGTTLRVVATVVQTVEPARGLDLWGRYEREAIARAFGSRYSRPWQVGHLDLEVDGQPHTILMVTLRKEHMAEEHRYADRFLSPTEFQWESQAQTAPDDTKGRNIVQHEKQGRTVHLFVRWHGKTPDQKGEPFVYCGPVTYLRHQGAKPMRVWWRVERELPAGLWKAWTE